MVSSLRHSYWCVAFCAVNRLAPRQSVMHHWTDDQQASIDSQVSADNRVDSSSPSQRSKHAMKPDIGWESRFLPTPAAFNAPVMWVPSEYCHAVWYRKTRMVWLPDGAKILKICLFVFTIHKRDGHTHRHIDTSDTAWPRLHNIARQKP